MAIKTTIHFNHAVFFTKSLLFCLLTVPHEHHLRYWKPMSPALAASSPGPCSQIPWFTALWKPRMCVLKRNGTPRTGCIFYFKQVPWREERQPRKNIPQVALGTLPRGPLYPHSWAWSPVRLSAVRSVDNLRKMALEFCRCDGRYQRLISRGMTWSYFTFCILSSFLSWATVASPTASHWIQYQTLGTPGTRLRGCWHSRLWGAEDRAYQASDMSGPALAPAWAPSLSQVQYCLGHFYSPGPRMQC